MGDAAKSVASYLVGQSAMAAPALEPALYLVATPIGNLADITLRALETLAAADIVACEDTRVTRVLLGRYAIRKRLTAYHEHNAGEVGARLIKALAQGRSVALVSDAGTPLVSDPGYRLVREAQGLGFRIVPIPGPSAVMAALIASGLPSQSFFFAGFLPVKAGPRASRLEALKAVPGTLIFFESPRRMTRSLAAMVAVFGEREAAVGRELTKVFEEVRRGTLDELASHYSVADTPKGEIVILVGPPETTPADPGEVDRLLLSAARHKPAAKAAGDVARLVGGRKSELYRRLLELRRDDGSSG